MPELDPLSVDFAGRHPDAFARALARGDAGEASRVLERLPAEHRAAIAARLPAAQIKALLSSGEHRPEEWLARAPFDDAVNLLSRIPRDQRLAIVQSLDDRERKRQLLRHQHYPAHTVGALVGDLPMRVSAGTPAATVQAELRGLDAEDPGPLVVVDAAGHYVGMLNRWRLLVADDPTGPVSHYAREVKPVRPEVSIADVAMSDAWQERHWLPVVDHRGRVLGGVARARVFRAANAHVVRARRSSDFAAELFGDLVYLINAMLERALSGKGRW